VSHALPSPSSSAHAFPTTVFSVQRYPSQDLPWIHVSHIVGPSYHLADFALATASMFTSPDDGSAIVIMGDGSHHTTQAASTAITAPPTRISARIFDVAVPIEDPIMSPSRDTSPISPSPSLCTASPFGLANPALPPNSIHISILERFIPPSSIAEFASLFSISAPSILTDRLIELSPDGGLALFIYPTKTGGTTFMRSHLGPVLDPVLRSLGVLHGFPPDLISSVGRMPTIDALPEFEAMEAGVTEICNQLSNLSTRSYSNSSPKTAPPVIYETIVAQKTRVSLDSSVWPEHWWAPQEQERIKSLIRAYIPTSGGWSSRSGYSATVGSDMGGMHHSSGMSNSGMPSIPSRSASTSAALNSLNTAARAQSMNHHRSSLHESNATPTILTHEIINGVVNRVRARHQALHLNPGGYRGSSAGGHPPPSTRSRPSFHSDEQIEVGVFVIRKTTRE